ncbi:SDR family oxidoreductase [Nitrososphaera sp.]|uniref:SDR family NAD(P)-dependent oxidoreductase n=1 Tax=Nitrososphaera sp. TaxID=1971748 RepID=UPI00307D5854
MVAATNSSNSAITAIVTGAGRGIGKETALLLAARGVNVAVCSRTQGEIDRVAGQISRLYSRRVLGMKCDVGDAGQVMAFVAATVERFGPYIDILVNNAGVAVLKRLEDTTEKEWDETINSNLKSAFLCCKAVLPCMKSSSNNSGGRGGGGTIINVSSVAGTAGFQNLSAYCASKFGMMGLTASLAWEVPAGVRVMAMCPGDVDTDMQDVDPQYRRANRHRMLTARQVAEKIVEMIFDKSRYRNGQSVVME